MIKDRSLQIRHRELAKAMITFGMRATLIANILDMSQAQARQLFEEITGHSSPSGQTPRSNEYYFQPVMRVHAAFFLTFYLDVARGVTSRDREALVTAFVAAYAHYHSMCAGNPTMPIDRAWRLLQLFMLQDGTVTTTRCANPKCRAFTIVQPWEAATRYTCPPCQGALEVSERLRGRSGRKRLPAAA